MMVICRLGKMTPEKVKVKLQVIPNVELERWSSTPMLSVNIENDVQDLIGQICQLENMAYKITVQKGEKYRTNGTKSQS